MKEVGMQMQMEREGRTLVVWRLLSSLPRPFAVSLDSLSCASKRIRPSTVNGAHETPQSNAQSSIIRVQHPLNSRELSSLLCFPLMSLKHD